MNIFDSMDELRHVLAQTSLSKPIFTLNGEENTTTEIRLAESIEIKEVKGVTEEGEQYA